MGAGVRFATVQCVLHLVISPTKQRGYDLLRALGSATCDITHETGVRFVTGIGLSSCDITYETGGTTCDGHWVLHVVISHTRQGVQFATDIGFCVL